LLSTPVDGAPGLGPVDGECVLHFSPQLALSDTIGSFYHAYHLEPPVFLFSQIHCPGPKKLNGMQFMRQDIGNSQVLERPYNARIYNERGEKWLKVR